ncbi:hypothetical protein LIER_22840 [Lithospermum erythrorhizon]|uniref:Uncharacterized protein n=1 Tax=Lithospermum erythrorhizon TaxID=34254 RepID=A0AAV3QWI9_LITER
MFVQKLVMLLVLSTNILCSSAVNFINVTTTISNNIPALQNESMVLWENQRRFENLLGRRKKHKSCKTNPNACKNISNHHACCSSHACVDILTSKYHCGSCHRICNHEKICCGGSCVDVNSNRDHCGKCGNACAPDETCAYGICGYA